MGKGNGKAKDGLAVGFCLDESASMMSCFDETISGFNEYVDGLRGQEGDTFLSLTMFSSDGFASRSSKATYRPFCEAAPIASVDRLSEMNYRPDGNTPLYDAIGHTINRLAAQLDGMKKKARPEAVLFVIQTDGEENSSREFTQAAIRDLIAEKEKAGWRFMYLGADQDEMQAERAATAMGVNTGASMAYASPTADAAFGSMAVASATLRSTPTATAASVRDTAKASYDERLKAKAKKP